jgi:hypothetical protein
MMKGVTETDPAAAELDRVKTWLAGKGYPLEYATARILRRVGFETEQGHYVVDARETPPRVREVDVIAKLAASRDDPHLRVIVECKRPSHPWIVLSERRPLSSIAVIDSLVASRSAAEALQARATRVVKSRNPLPDYLASADQVGFAVAEARPGRPPKDEDLDPPYLAIRKLAGAAEALLRDHELSWAVMLSLLVVDGSLYQLRVDQDGEDVVEPILWQRVLWRGTSGRPTCVDVVTLPALESRARVLHDGAQQLITAIRLEREDRTAPKV